MPTRSLSLAIVLGAVAAALGAPVPPLRAATSNNAACDTAEEQQGVLCQSACGCSCPIAAGDAAPTAGDETVDICPLVCALPNGVGSVPWCATAPPPPPLPPGIVVETDVVFMTAFGRDYKLDIYSDSTVTADQPLALIIHGGGFVGGDKADRAMEATLFAARGFRAVSINYPLCSDFFDHTTQALHPWNSPTPTNGENWRCQGVASGTDDLPEEIRGSLSVPATRAARLAIKHMHADAAQHDVDTSKTVCHGRSAGSITCYSTLFFNTTTIPYPDIPNALGPDPELDQYQINVAAAVAGGMAPGNEHIANVTQDTVDAMVPGAAVWDLHGDNDTVVPLESSDNMMAIAAQHGIPHGQVVVEGEGHGVALNLTLADDMFDFIFDNLANAPTVPTAAPSTPPSSMGT